MSIMRMNQTVIFFLAVIFSLAAQAESPSTPETTVRKTVNADGKVIFSKSGFAERKSAKQATPVEEVKALSKPTTPKVDIYYASWDPYSNKAIIFFRENHIVVNAYDIDLDSEAATRKKRIDPSFVGMPLVIINGVTIRGVDEEKYREALALPPR
jgi:hypothetical protein